MSRQTKPTTEKAGRSIADLKPDLANVRKHNPRNIGMIVDSLHQVGAARSIVIDEDDTILAGNGVIEAAAEAGITKMQIVEADGETVIAVRRRGLTGAQKQSLAIFDNRTAELATWDADALQALQQQGADLGAYFREEELLCLLQSFEVSTIDASTLADGDKSDFEQMTFTLHRDQAVTVRAAIDTAKAAGHGTAVGGPNKNSNGNALAWICEKR